MESDKRIGFEGSFVETFGTEEGLSIVKMLRTREMVWEYANCKPPHVGPEKNVELYPAFPGFELEDKIGSRNGEGMRCRCNEKNWKGTSCCGCGWGAGGIKLVCVKVQKYQPFQRGLDWSKCSCLAKGKNTDFAEPSALYFLLLQLFLLLLLLFQHIY